MESNNDDYDDMEDYGEDEDYMTDEEDLSEADEEMALQRRLQEGAGEETDDVIDEKVRALLQRAIRQKKIPESGVERYVSRFLHLHHTYKDTEERERLYLKKNQDIYKELMLQREKLKTLQKEKSQRLQFMSDLRREFTKADHQVTVASDQNADQSSVVVDEEREILRIQREIEKQKKERIEREQPIIEAYTRDIKHLTEECDEYKSKTQNHKEESQKIIDKIIALEDSIEKVEKEIETYDQQFNDIKEEPDRVQKQTDLIRRTILNSEKDIKKKQELVDRYSAKNGTLDQEKSSLSKTMYQSFMQEEHELKRAENLDKDITKVEMTAANEAELSKQLDARLFSLTNTLNAKKRTLQEKNEILRAKKKMEEHQIKQISKTQSNIKLIQRHLDRQNQKLKELDDEKLEIEKMKKETSQKLNDTAKAVDIIMNDFLNDEDADASIKNIVLDQKSNIDELKGKIDHSNNEEAERQKKLTELSSQRESSARDASSSKQRFVDTMGEVKIQSFVNSELRKNYQEIETNNKQLIKLYSMMKQDRNKYQQNIQKNVQTLSQIFENKKVLDNEHEVLSRKSLEKEKQLIKIRRKYDELSNQREQLRGELSKLQLTLRTINSDISESNNEISKLNAIITHTEDDMLGLKSQYESRVEERNFTGIQLIDRNDELCILYEKANVQENVIKKGQVELQKKNTELSQLTNQLKDLQRELAIVYKRMPDLNAAIAEKQELENQLIDAAELAQEYTLNLEDPGYEERWRKLSGEVPEKDVLDERIRLVEEKLNNKKELVMEKNLILQEITKSSDQLRKLAISGREHSFDIAVGMNQIQAKIREEDKKTMATLSELSVHQSRVQQLDAHNQQLQIHIDNCKKRISKGLPPTKDMEKEWEKQQQLNARHRDMMARRKEELEMQREMPATVTRTTAIQRPNAYVPDDDLPLPRPYFMKPVMYSQASANLRHFKKPKKDTIVI